MCLTSELLLSSVANWKMQTLRTGSWRSNWKARRKTWKRAAHARTEVILQHSSCYCFQTNSCYSHNLPVNDVKNKFSIDSIKEIWFCIWAYNVLILTFLNTQTFYLFHCRSKTSGLSGLHLWVFQHFSPGPWSYLQSKFFCLYVCFAIQP